MIRLKERERRRENTERANSDAILVFVEPEHQEWKIDHRIYYYAE